MLEIFRGEKKNAVIAEVKLNYNGRGNITQ